MIYELHKPSDNGTSTWLRWLGCPRAAAWHERDRGNPHVNSLGNRAMQIGTVGHALLDLYHRTGVCEERVAFTNHDGLPELFDAGVIDEGVRVAQGYAKQRTATHFGSYVASELTLDSDDITCAVTGSVANSWSGRVDLIAGTTLVDWKFVGRFGETQRARYSDSLQIRAYMLAAAAAGYEITRGVACLISTTKEVRIEEIEIPFPSRREIAMIHGVFRDINRIREERRDEVNITMCHDSWGKPCEFYSTCNRIGG